MARLVRQSCPDPLGLKPRLAKPTVAQAHFFLNYLFAAGAGARAGAVVGRVVGVALTAGAGAARLGAAADGAVAGAVRAAGAGAGAALVRGGGGDDGGGVVAGTFRCVAGVRSPSRPRVG